MTDTASHYNRDVIPATQPTDTSLTGYNPVRLALKFRVDTESSHLNQPPIAAIPPPNAHESATGDGESPNPNAIVAYTDGSPTTILTLSEPAIDSIQIKIPIATEVMDSRRTEKQERMPLLKCRYNEALDAFDITYNDQTGEETRRRQSTTQIEDTGIGTTYRKEIKTIGNQSVTQISIGFSSKLLGIDYLKGITLDTIRQAYKSILSHGIIDIDYDEFMKAAVWLADTKIDLQPESIQKTFALIRQYLRPELIDKERIYTAKVYRHQTGSGLAIHGIIAGKRADRDHQLVKFYDKSYELLTNSSIFSERYLKGIDIDNLLRIEVTSYNDNLTKAYGESYNRTLRSLLQHTHDHGTQMVRDLLTSTILSNIPRPPPQPAVVADKDQQLADLIGGFVEMALQLGWDEIQTTNHILKCYHVGRDKTLDIRRLVPQIYEYQTQQIESLEYTPRGI